MATHSSIPWRIPWTEEPGRLDSIGSQRVGRDENIQYPSSLTLRKVMSLHNLTKSPSLFSRRWAQRKLGPCIHGQALVKSLVRDVLSIL